MAEEQKIIGEITAEDVEALRRLTAYMLPDSPAAAGLPAAVVRKYFYQWLTDNKQSIVALINRIVGEVNERFDDCDETEDSLKKTLNKLSEDISLRMQRLNIIVGKGYPSFDTENGTLTFPASTVFQLGKFRTSLSAAVTISLHPISNTSENHIFYNKNTGAFENLPYWGHASLDLENYYYVCSFRMSWSGGGYMDGASNLDIPYYVDGELFGAATVFPRPAMIVGSDYISIDNENGTVTIPKGTEFVTKGMNKILSADVTVSLNSLSDTSSTMVCYNKSTDRIYSVIPWRVGTITDAGVYHLFTVRRTNSSGLKVCADIGMPYYIDGVLYGGGDSATKRHDTKAFAFSLDVCNTDNVETFLFFTDPHLCQYEGDAWREEFDTYMATLKGVYDSTPVSRVFCGGDWLGGDISKTEDACFRLGLADAKMREAFGDRYHNIRGNHESNFEYSVSNPVLNRSTIRNLLFRKEGKTYYSVDGDKCKFFVFDSQDEPSTLYDNDYATEQLKWFAEALKNNEAENIVLMMHMVCATNSIGTITSFASQVMGIAGAFNNRFACEVDGTEYDFTDANGTVRFMMGGHSHEDYDSYEDIPYILTTHMRDRGKPTFDLCCADFDNGTLTMIRVGTGEMRTISI